MARIISASFNVTYLTLAPTGNFSFFLIACKLLTVLIDLFRLRIYNGENVSFQF